METNIPALVRRSDGWHVAAAENNARVIRGSIITFADWQEAPPPNAQDTSAPGSAVDPSTPTALLFPRTIRVARPQQDYQLSVVITKLALNAQIPPDRFNLMQPAGTELVNLAAGRQEPQP